MPPVVRRGGTGDWVLQAQRLLRTHFAIVLDSHFGVETDAAVRCFQREHHLLDDGIVGDRTWDALESAASPSVSSRSPIAWRVEGLKWRSQLDNLHHPHGTCNVTALATVMDWCGIPEPPSRQLEDVLFARLQLPDAREYFRRTYPTLQRYNPRNVHGMLRWLATKYGLNAEFSADSSWSDSLAFARVDGGRPTIQAVDTTGFGHIVTLTGETALGDPIVHDPFGDWERGYGVRMPGAYRIYRLKRFLERRKPFLHRILPFE